MEGLAERGAPMRDIAEGDAGRAAPTAKRATAGAGATGSGFSRAGPVTRRSRSSSCVFSLAGRGPTNDHTFSPTKA